ncbi:MAG: LLM class flavin-dependent oxidoreductase, partial [Chloroflexi bacterium]|nr:LLM class flavin-dependent oxidoreductase [Chloroflexota bacterium]
YQQYEFTRLGLDLDQARTRWDEAVDIILAALEGQPFSYHGRHYDIPETTVFPQPKQRPYPPIWVTAQSPQSVEATVRRGFNLLTGGFGVPVERMADFRRQFDALLAEVRPARMPEVGVQRAVYVTDSEADARQAVDEARWNMRVTLSLRNNYERVENGHAIPVSGPTEPSTDDLLDRYLVIGTPDTVRKQIMRLEEVVGIGHFNCSFWFGDMDQQRVLRSMRLFAEEVMPAFEPAGARAAWTSH